MLTLFSPSLVPTDYPTRLLRFCISSFSPLLERKDVSASAAASKNESGGGKRGKKRARNAEDGLVGDLEGKGRQSLGAGVVDVILQALKRESFSLRTYIVADGTQFHLYYIPPLSSPLPC